VLFPGLEKNPGFIEKACRQVNSGFITGFSSKTGFLKQVFSPKMFICGVNFG
jgi:hypothetical protein